MRIAARTALEGSTPNHSPTFSSLLLFSTSPQQRCDPPHPYCYSSNRNSPALDSPVARTVIISILKSIQSKKLNRAQKMQLKANHYSRTSSLRLYFSSQTAFYIARLTVQKTISLLFYCGQYHVVVNPK